VKDKARKRMALAERALASLERFRAGLAEEGALPAGEAKTASAPGSLEESGSGGATIDRTLGTGLSGG